MPYEISTFTLPCGARAARVRIHGVFEGHEASAAMGNWAPGGPMHGVPGLVLTQEVTRAAPEARSIFGGWKETSTTEWFAVVVTSPVLRVTGNFILRVSKSTRRKMFTTEADAVRWLDERARESGAK
jgi:hypothetical protein